LTCPLEFPRALVVGAGEQQAPLLAKERRKREAAQHELARLARREDPVIARAYIPPISRQVSELVSKYVSPSYAQALEREQTPRAMA